MEDLALLSLLPQGNAWLCRREGTPRPWVWGKPDLFEESHPTEGGFQCFRGPELPALLARSSLSQAGSVPGQARLAKQGETQRERRIPGYLICPVFPPRCLPWLGFLN